MRHCHLAMSGSSIRSRSSSSGRLIALGVTSCFSLLLVGCTATHETEEEAQPPAPVQVPVMDEGAAPPVVNQAPSPFGEAWLLGVQETLEIRLWEGDGFQEDWSARLRWHQHSQGNLPAFLTDFQWSSLAEAALVEAENLSSHGVEQEQLPYGVIETLKSLRLRLAELPPLTGLPMEDGPRVAATIHAEQALCHLLMRLTELLGTDQASIPMSTAGAQLRLLDALPTWRNEPAVVHTLAPPMLAYERLRAALERYEAIAASGGFVELNRRVLRRTRPRRTHRTLGELRRRLAQEDPLVTMEGDQWDDDMTEALRRAREAYQLRRTGPRSKLVDDKLLKALSVPVEERIRTLKHNLARWRASEARLHDYAVHVNLPDYHAELRSGGELIRRFKIVIGSAKKTRESKIMRNATPLLSSAIRKVIYNPYWNIPERILLEELLPEAHRALKKAADEREAQGEEVNREELLTTEAVVEYFNTNGYEVLNQTKSGRLWVRQLPGPTNALGKVKFIFPNPHSVFMHDTPSKGKFRFPRRAFSHGCMRVHEPLEFARTLLERDGSWSKYRARKGLRTLKQLVIPLESPVPLVVDYITNHVDEGGRVHWLHDVYGYDPS